MQCNYSVGVMQYDASVPIEKRCGAHFQKMISLFMRLNVLNDIKKKQFVEFSENLPSGTDYKTGCQFTLVYM